MSIYKGYNEIGKKASMKYNKEKRESLTLNLPKGKKDKLKEQAISKGFSSLTAYIIHLIEQDK